MKNKQGTHVVNAETIRIIQNLRQKGVIEKNDRNHYLNLMTECLKMKYGEKQNAMALIDEHGQRWCMEHGIIGHDYLVEMSISNRKADDRTPF